MREPTPEYLAKMPLVEAIYNVLRDCENVYGLEASEEMRTIDLKYLRQADGSRQMSICFPGHIADCIVDPKH
jgi:hypothetical protein